LHVFVELGAARAARGGRHLWDTEHQSLEVRCRVRSSPAGSSLGLSPRDPKLGRELALKVLPADVSTDAAGIALVEASMDRDERLVPEACRILAVYYTEINQELAARKCEWRATRHTTRAHLTQPPTTPS
jgi:hypothetical protein